MKLIRTGKKLLRTPEEKAQKTRRMPTFQITQRLQKYIDAPYQLGISEKRGWDCLSLLMDFYGGLGVKMLKGKNGITTENYAEKWTAGEGRAELLEFLQYLGTPVERNYALIGDLMIFKEEIEGQTHWYGGIFLGRGHILLAFEKGVRVVPLKFMEFRLIEVRRCF